jgi:hypothetical protein
MIVPQKRPSPPSQVFMLATPEHMLAKLHWELHTLRKALSEKPEHLVHMHAPSYCAFNCAVTVWHLGDWTWHISSAEQRSHILACLGVEGGGNLTKFQNALRDKSRALHICRQLATGSKHVIVEKYPDPDVRAEMRWESQFAYLGRMRTGDPLAVHHYRLVVADRGVERPALDVFEEAFESWQRFLRQWGLIEGGLVPAPSRSA